ncbi:Heme-NO binding [Trinorchestia longiramus]|nr:Heme-NO binding [Trinorchestia longiramus]
MACPFSSYFVQKNAGETSDDNKDSSRGKACPGDTKSDYPVSNSRKASVTLADARMQHQGSFSMSFCQGSFSQRDETSMKREPQPRIVWERGPSLEHLKGANGVGVVQQRVHSFSQQLNKPDNANCSCRSVSPSPAKTNDDETGPRLFRPARRSRGSDDRPLLHAPKLPLDPKEPLSLKNLTEAVWSFITIPADVVLQALDKMLSAGDGEMKSLRRKLSIVADGLVDYDDWHIDDMLLSLSKQLEISEEDFMSRFGRIFAMECEYLYRKPLSSLGYNLEGFLTNLTGVLDILQQAPDQTNQLSTKNDVPTLLCNQQGGRLTLHFHTNREPLRYFMGGAIQGISECVFRRKVKTKSTVCTPSRLDRHRYYFKYAIIEGGPSLPSLQNVGHRKAGRIETRETQAVGSLNTVRRLDGSDSHKELPLGVVNSIGRLDTVDSKHVDTENSLKHESELLSDETSRSISDIAVDTAEGKDILSCGNKDTSLIERPDLQHSEAATSKEMPNIREEEELYAQGLLEDSLQELSSDVRNAKMNVSTFCSAFPWHFVCDRKMRIIQMGTALVQIYGAKAVKEAEKVSKYFKVVSPERVPLEYKEIAARLNTAYVLSIKNELSSKRKVEAMELKGQMVDCPESESLLFVGSPLLDGMESLTSRGLYISDIPIHDATRDVILVGEQSRAQDSIKRRMTQIKENIVEANKAVDEEREKNVSLLHLIFPPDIAKRLWLGEVIDAQKHDAVTMLFSDIVGFTSICSTATPFMVISMLQDLYTKFDVFCGQLDVYKRVDQVVNTKRRFTISVHSEAFSDISRSALYTILRNLGYRKLCAGWVHSFVAVMTYLSSLAANFVEEVIENPITM